MRQIDHLVVAAQTLEQGRRWLEGKLGVPMQAGGQHPQFGTHNALLRLGGAYLEVIAVDPGAPEPARPRWFGLGTAEMQMRLQDGPQLVHWVVRGSGLARHPQALPLERGANRWWLTVPASGSLPHAGLAPSQIEWLSPPPPSYLPNSGLRLSRLELCAPKLTPLQPYAGHWEGNVKVVLRQAKRPRLRAALDTGHQTAWLEG